MSLDQSETAKLKELIREIVREELQRMQSATSDVSPSPEGKDIDDLADKIFERYDDVFKALA